MTQVNESSPPNNNTKIRIEIWVALVRLWKTTSLGNTIALISLAAAIGSVLYAVSADRQLDGRSALRQQLTEFLSSGDTVRIEADRWFRCQARTEGQPETERLATCSEARDSVSAAYERFKSSANLIPESCASFISDTRMLINALGVYKDKPQTLIDGKRAGDRALEILAGLRADIQRGGDFCGD